MAQQANKKTVYVLCRLVSDQYEVLYFEVLGVYEALKDAKAASAREQLARISEKPKKNQEVSSFHIVKKKLYYAQKTKKT